MISPLFDFDATFLQENRRETSSKEFTLHLTLFSHLICPSHEHVYFPSRLSSNSITLNRSPSLLHSNRYSSFSSLLFHFYSISSSNILVSSSLFTSLPFLSSLSFFFEPIFILCKGSFHNSWSRVESDLPFLSSFHWGGSDNN